MALFKVKAGTLEGRIFLKEIEAGTKEDIARQLEKEGMYPIDIRAKGFTSDRLRFFERKIPVRGSDLLVFNQGLTALLKAGLSIVESLDTMRRSTKNARLSDAIKDVVHGVRTGHSLSDALGRHPDIFPPLYISSIGAGERTGDIIHSIKGYIQYQKRIEAIRKKIVSSAIYPCVLSIASALVVGFLITYVVPSFAKIYIGAGAELPLPTRFLIYITEVVKGYILFFAGAGTAAAFAVRGYLRTDKGAFFLDNLKLSLPQLGEIYSGYSIAKFSRTLGMVLNSGIPLVQALGMSKGVLDNRVLAKKLETVIKKVKEGEPVHKAVADADFMPEVTLTMFSVGERSASLPEILDEIADYHEEDVSHKVGILTDLVEPALIIVMGVVIGAIVVLMYLPIFQLGARM